ncbi:helix-turn-helix domain-containing protein [Zavarzinella formosa]|uniref:helix-turn-helix domain-containing protein n=1 Tax=Zavarzinella formosa TaxID=360055 RepID=UPI000319BE6A|nr:helix-turn-helix domain-containing protein [Zavarzinella formosa]
MTVKQAAGRIGVSVSLIYALCQEGIIAHARHGRKGKRGVIRIEDAEVERYREACKGGAGLPPGLKHIRVS